MLCIEGHLGLELPRCMYISDLNVLYINVLPNGPIQLLLVLQKMDKGMKIVPKRGSLSIDMPTVCNRRVTSTNQQWTCWEDLVGIMAIAFEEWYAM